MARAQATSGSGGAPKRSAWPRKQQTLDQTREAESILSQLTELENKHSDSIAECARWFNLNMRYIELTKGRNVRESEQRKKEQCDHLDKIYSDFRSKFSAFRSLLDAQSGQLEFVGNLVSGYLDLKYATELNPQLASELDLLVGSDERVHFGLEQAEHFMQFMANALNLAHANRPTAPVAPEPEPEPSIQEPTLGETGAVSREIDELSELDSTLKHLIDNESRLSEAELKEMYELGRILEIILADGNVDFNSGRFKYLSGTLDAVRAVLWRQSILEEEGPTADGQLRGPLGQTFEEAGKKRAGEQSSQAGAQLAEDGHVRAAPVPPQFPFMEPMSHIAAASASAAGAASTSGATTAVASLGSGSVAQIDQNLSSPLKQNRVRDELQQQQPQQLKTAQTTGENPRQILSRRPGAQLSRRPSFRQQRFGD